LQFDAFSPNIVESSGELINKAVERGARELSNALLLVAQAHWANALVAA
jgi:hypothetical protein